MSNTSWQVKAKYNKKAYKQFACRIKPDLFEEINSYCEDNNLSKSQFLKIAIDKLKKK